jgi:hypothetical protein
VPSVPLLEKIDEKFGEFDLNFSEDDKQSLKDRKIKLEPK